MGGAPGLPKFCFGEALFQLFILVLLKSEVIVEPCRNTHYISLGGITICDCVDRTTGYVDRWMSLNILSESLATVIVLFLLSLLKFAFLKSRLLSYILNHNLPGYHTCQNRNLLSVTVGMQLDS